MEDLKTEMGKGRGPGEVPLAMQPPTLLFSKAPSIYLSTCLPPYQAGCGGLAAVLLLDLLTSVLFLGGHSLRILALLSDISQWLLGHQRCSGISSKLPYLLDALGGVWACGDTAVRGVLTLRCCHPR